MSRQVMNLQTGETHTDSMLLCSPIFGLVLLYIYLQYPETVLPTKATEMIAWVFPK